MFEPLSEARREFLARSVMDVVKFVTGAGLISGFLWVSPLPVKIAVAVMILVCFVGAWLLFPAKGGR